MNTNVANAKKNIVARFMIENVLFNSQLFFLMKKRPESPTVAFAILGGLSVLVGQESKTSMVQLGQGTQVVFVHMALPTFREFCIPSLSSDE
jgi:hypothetical protein